MKLDEAIKHLDESLADPGHDWGCEECKGEHEQLLEWLRELKDLREENKVLTSECDRLIKEKGELLKKSEQIAEYKRLLISAIDEWNFVCEWGDCGEHCVWYENGKCAQEWSRKAEALALIGEEANHENPT